ncbi:MAG: translocation/assembly module TamB domain-containing protein [Sphingopyxis sp.]
MSEAGIVKPRRRWLRYVVMAPILLLLIILGALLALDTSAGKRFLIDRIEAQQRDNGLTIAIGRVDGSIYSDPVLHDVRLGDPEGQFLSIGEARFNWRPMDFVWQRQLTIDTLVIPRARLDRLPKLQDTDDDKPIFPDFDITIGQFRVDRLDIGARVARRAYVGHVAGDADVRGGSATVHIDARLIDGADRLRLALVAEPDQGDFDIDADLLAPANGVLAAMLGVEAETSAVIRGSGNWRNWRGSLLARSGQTNLASVRLGLREGRLTASGRVWPETQVDGAAQRIVAGGIAVDVDGRFADRRWSGRASLVSAALQLDSNGQADFANKRLSAMRIDARLRNSSSGSVGGRYGAGLFGLSGENVQASILLDGDWLAPRYEYRFLAGKLSINNMLLAGVEANGAGIAQRRHIVLPISLRIARTSGVSPLLDSHLVAMRVDGSMGWQAGVWSGEGISIRAAGLEGSLGLRMANGVRDMNLSFDGRVPGLELAKLGRADLVISARGVRAGGAPLTVSGTARAAVTRFDNGFLRGVAGGLPSLNAAFIFGADRVLRLSNVRLSAPDLALSGNGQRLSDGSFIINARGAHRRYGPVDMALSGPLDRPRIALTLASPLSAGDLRNVRLMIEPGEGGFLLRANGGSLLGDFTGEGRLLLPPGGVAALDIARLGVGGSIARGRLAIVQGGLDGQLTVGGGGLNGRMNLDTPSGIQRILINLAARDAGFSGPPAITIARGQLQATLLLDPAGTDAEATFETVGLRRGSLSIARMAGNAHLVNGVGTIRASMAGSRGRSFTFQTVMDVAPGRIVVRGDGTLAGQALRMSRSAVLTRNAGGWTLSPTELSYAGGRIQLSGRFGGDQTQIDAGLDSIPLSLLDLGWPNLGLGGRASGRLSYTDNAQGGGGGPPSGSAQLRVRGLARAGLVDVSAPVDLAINAALAPTGASVRAIVERNGSVIGRAQARISPLSPTGALWDRLVAAPLFAQIRYDGEAGPLWRLTGVENLSLTGGVAIAADVNGSLNTPAIRGVVRAQNARVESLQTGTVITGISAIGQFDGSRLRLRDIRGSTAGGGSINGVGDIDLSFAGHLAMDIRLNATRALMIDRDDLVARVSGPLRLVRGDNGGMISGQLQLDQGRFRLGRATAIDSLPVINVAEVNVPADRPAPRQGYLPWRLDLGIVGRDGLTVTGLGINSLWSTDIAVRGDVANIAISGTARLVRGDYDFAGRRFALQSGTIRFDGSVPSNPVLDIVAVDDVAGIDASIHVRGTGLRPEVTFASVPALPEDELLSRILFGTSITNISVTEAAQLGLALAALRDGGEGLDPINALRRATGLDRLRILPADTALGAGTSISAGKYVTRRVYVEVITDGRGYSATRVEYQITRWLALLGSISTLGRDSVNVRVHRDY